MSLCQTRVEFQRAPQVLFGAREVPVRVEFDLAQSQICFTQRLTQLLGLTGSGLGAGVGVREPVMADETVTERQRSICLRVRGVFVNCLLEIRQTPLESFRGEFV